MSRSWLLIPSRGVAIEVNSVLGESSDPTLWAHLVEAVRAWRGDALVRMCADPNPLAYVRVAGRDAERLAALRGVPIRKLRALAEDLRGNRAPIWQGGRRSGQRTF
jgi:hypothetical protein